MSKNGCQIALLSNIQLTRRCSGSWLGTFFGDLSQSEKLFEIKPPLNKTKVVQEKNELVDPRCTKEIVVFRLTQLCSRSAPWLRRLWTIFHFDPFFAGKWPKQVVKSKVRELLKFIFKKSNPRSNFSKRAPTNVVLFTFSKGKLLYLHSTRAWFSLCFESKERFLEVPFDHHRLLNPICNQQDFQQHSLSYLLLWSFCLWHLSHIFLKKIENNHLTFETTFLSNCNYNYISNCHFLLLTVFLWTKHEQENCWNF